MAPRLSRTTGRKLVRALQQLGWEIDRIKGSHHILRHPDKPRVTLSVPVHGNRTIPIGTLTDILRDAQVDVERFNELV
ncbi:MAG: type II toxin-antitoxin system HicA family toxin [Dehalococcoidia bacterium]